MMLTICTCNILCCVSNFLLEIIWVILQVEDHGLLGVTQAMSSFGGDVFSHPQPPPQQADNPFASPNKPNISGTSCIQSSPLYLSVTILY